ncbi:MAG: hypothetical protein K2Q25_02355 [Mycobacteriaceae bacterium]|nr:hypothetical protein [Mycobacteriaceae bacterium]
MPALISEPVGVVEFVNVHGAAGEGEAAGFVASAYGGFDFVANVAALAPGHLQAPFE